MSKPAPRCVLIVLPSQVQLMDVAGPAQVFVSAAEAGGRYSVCYVAGTDPQPEPAGGVPAGGVPAHQGLMLSAGTKWPDLRPGDLLLVPGWKTSATGAGLTAAALQRISEHWQSGGHVASVCAGALALADAGVLSGQRATTHHDVIDQLARFPGTTVLRDVLYTCSDRLHTSAGVASGIDLALHLVAHDHGPALAARVARTLVVPAWRPGAAPQVSVLLSHRDHLSDLTHRAQDILDDPSRPAESLDRLAARLGVSGRTLARHFTRATGLTPAGYAAAVRREHAAQLQSQGWTQQAAAAAVGYADARSLRQRSAQR